jgi:hypothetical protein
MVCITHDKYISRAKARDSSRWTDSKALYWRVTFGAKPSREGDIIKRISNNLMTGDIEIVKAFAR